MMLRRADQIVWLAACLVCLSLNMMNRSFSENIIIIKITQNSSPRIEVQTMVASKHSLKCTKCIRLIEFPILVIFHPPSALHSKAGYGELGNSSGWAPATLGSPAWRGFAVGMGDPSGGGLPWSCGPRGRDFHPQCLAVQLVPAGTLQDSGRWQLSGRGGSCHGRGKFLNIDPLVIRCT